jgi:GT2 family glycosyltransferase
VTARRRYAVIPTGSRPDLYRACIEAITPQVDEVLTLATSLDALRYSVGRSVFIGSGLNISHWWNQGIGWAHAWCDPDPFDVAVLNDDALVPPDWFDQVTSAMRDWEAAAGGSDQHSRDGITYLDDHDTPDIRLRLPGYAFILDGTARLRADEQFCWWWGDTDLDWRAREAGGVVLVPGIPVDHPPNGGTAVDGELAEVVARDRQRFIDKWGSVPW